MNSTEQLKQILDKSISSGINGAKAMTIQVCSLMWMRTIMNYQYRYGGSIYNSISLLYKEGGIKRFYRGIVPALAQGPLSRFGDTFSNSLALSICKSNKYLNQSPIWLQTSFASFFAGTFRIALMPVDATKTILQVEGKNGLNMLKTKIKTSGPQVLFHGAIATSTATMVGHYPWFMTYNYLNSYLAKYNDNRQLVRNAFIGFTSSVVSDTISNSLRVIKTTKQTYQHSISYKETINDIITKDGYSGLFGRGLAIRLCTNGIQGLLFSVLWNIFNDK